MEENKLNYCTPEEREALLKEGETMEVPERTEDFDHSLFPPLKNTLMLDSIQGKEISRVPVWVMRQAGRYLNPSPLSKRIQRSKRRYSILRLLSHA
jgi:hypothetical protein